MSICPGCGLELPRRGGPTHAYMGASPECWALYGELLAGEYGSYDGASHRLTVDAYAVQHPGVPERRAIQSVGLHLAALWMVLERGVDPAKVTELMRRLLARKMRFEWLEPPSPNGAITAADVLGARKSSREWAEDVWSAWAPYHETVSGWIDP